MTRPGPPVKGRLSDLDLESNTVAVTAELKSILYHHACDSTLTASTIIGRESRWTGFLLFTSNFRCAAMRQKYGQ